MFSIFCSNRVFIKDVRTHHSFINFADTHGCYSKIAHHRLKDSLYFSNHNNHYYTKLLPLVHCNVVLVGVRQDGGFCIIAVTFTQVFEFVETVVVFAIVFGHQRGTTIRNIMYVYNISYN